MKTTQKQHPAQTLAVLAVLLLLALCLLAVLLSGAKTTRRLTERGQNAADSRTAAQYLATRVRQADAAGVLTLETFGDGDALCIREDGCQTLVYCYDGWLRELFTAEDGDFAPEDGERLLKAENLTASMENGCLTLSITAGGTPETAELWIRSGEEIAS